MKKFFRAFTFLELIISTGIFTVIAVSLYSAFRTGLFSYNTVDASFATEQNARLLLERMGRDLRNSFLCSKDNSRFKGDGASLSFFTVIDEYDKAGEVFPSLCRIEYAFAGSTLQRFCYKGVDAVTPEATADPEALSSSVKAISFEYAVPPPTLNAPYRWQGLWPEEETQQKERLPLAVKIKLALIQRDKNSNNSQRIVEYGKTVFLPQGG
jgi:type II secretory pathway component PulJ